MRYRCLPPGGDPVATADQLAAKGLLTEGDARAVRDFASFLAAGVSMHPETDEERALYHAWLPYMTGQGDPPPADDGPEP